MKLKKVLVVYTHPAYGIYKSTLDKVKKTLKKYRIDYNLADRDKLKHEQFSNRDLIIAVGGDGTFLRAAQFVASQPMFGVNADVGSKEGFFMSSDKNNFELILKKILQNKIYIKKFPRLEAFINNKKIETLALNELFIGPKKAYHAAKYILESGGKKERQKSSGVLVTTPAGSYAWAKACGIKTMHLDSKNFQFVVREPYEGKVFRNYKLKNGILKPNQNIKILSEMLDGIIVADSVGMEHSFKNGSKAAVKLSKNGLNVVWRKE
ncbi:MAG TPA: NAD(+)/NADH kinase [Candidatus Nanoarchaeia archaeon]|nr:NAD(+)/NADH kinase [Candidatus Nanoarchaeia archaeon]